MDIKFVLFTQVPPFPRLKMLCEGRNRLLRNAIIYTTVFILYKFPLGIHYTLNRVPPTVLPAQILEWIQNWRTYFFGSGIVFASFYPAMVFVMSTDLRNHFCGHSWIYNKLYKLGQEMWNDEISPVLSVPFGWRQTNLLCFTCKGKALWLWNIFCMTLLMRNAYWL